MLTIFCMAFFGKFSFKLLLISKEDRVKLAHFFLLVLKNLSLRHPHYCDLQKLIIGLRMFNPHLHKRRVKFMQRRSSK
jgi:hypothetical protein